MKPVVRCSPDSPRVRVQFRARWMQFVDGQIIRTPCIGIPLPVKLELNSSLLRPVVMPVVEKGNQRPALTERPPPLLIHSTPR